MSKQRRRGLGVKAIEKLKQEIMDRIEIEAKNADDLSEKCKKKKIEMWESGADIRDPGLYDEYRFKTAYHLGKSTGLANGGSVVLGLFRKAGF